MGPPDDRPGPDVEPAWVAPEAAAVPDAPGPVATVEHAPIGTVATVGAAAPGVDNEVRLPVPLRPMTMGDLLDGGFNVLRARPRIVLGLAAVFVVPVQLVVAWFNRNALEDFQSLLDQSLSNASARPQGSVGNPWATFGGTIATSLGQTLIAACLALLVVAWYSGEQPDGREVLRRLRPRVWALSGAWFLIHLLELVGGIAVVGSFVFMTLYVVAAPAIAIEGLGPAKGMSRASGLASRRFWPVLGFCLLSGLVASTFGQILSLIPQVIGFALGPDLGWIATGVGSILNQMVATVVVGASTALLYLDLRIRREGMDLAWAADRQLPA